MLNEQVVFILIDSGASHSYIDFRMVDKCCLSRSKHDCSWLVQLATGTKKRISELVQKCPLNLNGLNTMADLNIVPLGSYHILIGMDWLESHHAKLNCHNKTFSCFDEE